MLASKTFLANKFINPQYNMLTEIFTILYLHCYWVVDKCFILIFLQFEPFFKRMMIAK